ncbi:MAG: esterase [Fibrobacter sp.]|nr:esterase [Fibrobacter sp.]
MKSMGLASFGLAVALAATAANAFILTGSVADSKGKAVKGAAVSLPSLSLSTTTDGVGSFTLRDTPISAGFNDNTQSIVSLVNPGFIGINDGVLSFSQSGVNPVQVQIFDAVGVRVLNKTLQGSGSVDLRGFVKAEGTYFARVKMGSAMQNLKFTARGTYGSTYGKPVVQALKKEAAGGHLQVVADGFDTLLVALANLDTNVQLTLQKAAGAEPQFDFGWAKGNEPVPTRGCGKTWSRVKSGSYDFQWSKGKRTIRIDIPDNYDNNKPYRLVFGMHCMGGWAGGVQQEGYYGLKPLDKEKTTIFVAPEGNGNQAPWAQDDYTLFDELLADLQSNLCIDSSRVFSTGFSYGSMFSNGLSRNHQHVLRGVAVYETADVNIWLPQHSGKPIAWMGVLGLQDNLCTPAMGRSARNTALKYASAEGKDATKENATEYGGSGPHVCYNYKDVDERFPVRWCTQNGGHIWDHKDPGQTQSWVPASTWDFITQF